MIMEVALSRIAGRNTSAIRIIEELTFPTYISLIPSMWFFVSRRITFRCSCCSRLISAASRFATSPGELMVARSSGWREGDEPPN